jgi:ADP-ribose pyrophosphatase
MWQVEAAIRHEKEVLGRGLAYSSAMRIERESDLVEKLVDRQVVRKSNYMQVVVDTIETTDGQRRERDIVLHPGAVAVLAIRPDGRILLVRQYRHAAGSVLLELPAGTLDKLDDGSIEDPAVAGPRELYEETGYTAKTWRRLGGFWTAPGFAREHMTLLLATDLTADPNHQGPEPDERLLVEAYTLPELLARAGGDEIHDAKTLVGIFWLDALVRSGEVTLP